MAFPAAGFAGAAQSQRRPRPSFPAAGEKQSQVKSSQVKSSPLKWRPSSLAPRTPPRFARRRARALCRRRRSRAPFHSTIAAQLRHNCACTSSTTHSRNFNGWRLLQWHKLTMQIDCALHTLRLEAAIAYVDGKRAVVMQHERRNILSNIMLHVHADCVAPTSSFARRRMDTLGAVRAAIGRRAAAWTTLSGHVPRRRPRRRRGRDHALRRL